MKQETPRKVFLLLELGRESAAESLWIHQVPIRRHRKSLGLEPDLVLPGAEPEDLGLDGRAVPGEQIQN